MLTLETVTISATKNEVRAPKSNRASRSWPIPGSSPNGWAQLIPLKPPVGNPRLSVISSARVEPKEGTQERCEDRGKDEKERDDQSD